VRFLSISIILACAASVAYAQEQSTKPGFIGTWNNPNPDSPTGCHFLPRTLVVRLADDRRVVIDTLNNELGEWRWRREQEWRVCGPATGPEMITFCSGTHPTSIGSSFTLMDSRHLRLYTVGVEGPDACVYDRASDAQP
jgi:hypothetical protein